MFPPGWLPGTTAGKTFEIFLGKPRASRLAFTSNVYTYCKRLVYLDGQLNHSFPGTLLI